MNPIIRKLGENSTGIHLGPYCFMIRLIIIQDDTCFDFVIVGAGDAGCVLTRRLTEEKNWKVLVIEAGGEPPITSDIPGLFQLLALSLQDWAFYAEDDGRTGQALNHRRVAHTSGKMMGGSGCLDHLQYSRGGSRGFDEWEAVGNEGWNWETCLKYFKKNENMTDKNILNSSTKLYLVELFKI
ncbi:Glucose dehydrogenase [Eumeta japonica]|uniref:Glucose dehydrogenase n=1 Tax=Eumeta variegata TaxID=151549 RepID=A0A4C2A9F8_EUMVA|nr:Glucose dehydrogenase [Eumeta japonica]